MNELKRICLEAIFYQLEQEHDFEKLDFWVKQYELVEKFTASAERGQA